MNYSSASTPPASTFYADLSTEQYFGFGNKLRYHPTENTEGYFEAYLLQDQDYKRIGETDPMDLDLPTGFTVDDLINVWSPLAVGFDPKVAAGVAERLSKWGDRLVKVTGNDYYSACGRLLDAVVSGRLAHPGDPTLSNDVCTNAVRRYLGDEVWIPARVNKRRSFVGLAALLRAVWLADGVSRPVSEVGW